MINKQLREYTTEEIDRKMRENGYEIADDSWMFNLYSPSLRNKANISEEFLTSEFLYAIKWSDLLVSQKLPLDLIFKITNFVRDNEMLEPFKADPVFLISNVLVFQSVNEEYFFEFMKTIENRSLENEITRDHFYVNLSLNLWAKPENISDRLKLFLSLNKIRIINKEDEVRA